MPDERQRALDTLHSPRFIDKAPAQVWATLLDEGTYLCSACTMYRILKDNDEVRERRDQARHPACAKPRLSADLGIVKTRSRPPPPNPPEAAGINPPQPAAQHETLHAKLEREVTHLR